MNEIILSKKKNGMTVLLLTVVLSLAAVAAIIGGAIILEGGGSPPLLIAGIIWICIGWLPLAGLKVIGPQEALVLTLFGKYIGTLKDSGFYFVNPFCAAVNPAAKTKLNQSGDVDSAAKKSADGAVQAEVVSLGEERKAAMVSNLLVVLCGNHDAQPVVNSGSLY